MTEQGNPVNDQEHSTASPRGSYNADVGKDGGRPHARTCHTVTSHSPPHAVIETPAGEEEMWGHGDTRTHVLNQLE